MMVFGLDCTKDGGNIVDCGSITTVIDIGSYSHMFDFGAIVKTPEERQTNSDGLSSMQGICSD